MTVAKRYAWNALRGYLIRTGQATAGDFLPSGATGNTSIDYSRIPDEWDDIPPVRIDPGAFD